MRNRIISALIMLPLLVLVYMGDWALFVLCFAVSIAGIKEFFDAFASKGIHPSLGIASASLAGLYLLNIFLLYSKDGADGRLYLLWLVVSVLLSFILMFRAPERNAEDSMTTLTGILYIGFFAYHIVLMDQLAHGELLIWLVLITAFGTDIMAYGTGKMIGRHKLCPQISPNKTVEGAIGGAIGSGIFCVIFGLILLPELLIHCIIIGVSGGVISQMGDLTASVFKRKLGIKDYSSLIPGHGGIMDRIDSLLFTAPFVYYYCDVLLVK